VTSIATVVASLRDIHTALNTQRQETLAVLERADHARWTLRRTTGGAAGPLLDEVLDACTRSVNQLRDVTWQLQDAAASLAEYVHRIGGSLVEPSTADTHEQSTVDVRAADPIDLARALILATRSPDRLPDIQVAIATWNQLPDLLAALFHVVVNRRLATDASPTDISAFIDDIQAMLADDPDVDPAHTGSLIRSALDPGTSHAAEAHSTDAHPVGLATATAIRLTTVLAVLAEEDFTDDELDTILATAAERAGHRYG